MVTEAVAKNLHFMLVALKLESIKVKSSVLVGEENWLEAVPSLSNMMRYVGKHYPGGPWHAEDFIICAEYRQGTATFSKTKKVAVPKARVGKNRVAVP